MRRCRAEFRAHSRGPVAQARSRLGFASWENYPPGAEVLLARLLAVPTIERQGKRPEPRHGNLDVAGRTPTVNALRVSEERLLCEKRGLRTKT
jgi:hypothetical protein